MQTGVYVKQQLFDAVQSRSAWDEAEEKWWFSVLDVVAVLTDQPDYKKVRNYWKWLKNKLIAEGSQLVSESATNQLKLPAADGKKYLTEHEAVANRGGGVAKEARLRLEAETGRRVVSSQNAKQLQALNQASSKKPEGGI